MTPSDVGAPRPDFAMVGGQSDGKFYVIASKTLTQAELSYEVEYRDRLYFERSWTRDREWYTLSAEMRDITMVVGDSYADCFASLFAEWDPTPAPRTAIAEQRAITAARPAIDYTGTSHISR